MVDLVKISLRESSDELRSSRAVVGMLSTVRCPAWKETAIWWEGAGGVSSTKRESAEMTHSERESESGEEGV